MSDYELTGSGYIPVISVQPDNLVHFTIPGEPVSKERPRFNRATGSAYTPAKTKQAEKVIAELYRRETGLVFSGPIQLSIILYMGSKRRKDADNMAKLIQDALNKVAFEDDYQIHELFVSKRYTTPERARAEVILRELAIVETERIHHAEEDHQEDHNRETVTS